MRCLSGMLHTVFERGDTMDKNVENHEPEDLQEQLIRSMADFARENPEIAEAMNVMNMTMPEYFQAIDALRGGQVVAASSLTPFPLVEVTS